MFQSPTKDEARARIAELVENFERQLPDYQRGGYNETQTRRDFIDPFFQALGWDIDNRNGSAEAYREVIHEDKVKVGKATKAPDYSFRLSGGQRLFFVEAKKPSVKIKEEILPAYQVRRYGWSAKLVLSILTDFEELAVYDCTLQPAPTDKASKGRLKYLTFREYGTEFDFLWDTFSKESVLRGGLDKFVATGSGKRGKETVDTAFLTTLEAMRAELAQGLATRNPKLDADELRFLVQMLLDRIIFLRIAEDRGIEPYADLEAVGRVKKKDEVYLGLLDRFRTASARYNSGLFDLEKDTLSAAVRIDNAVIAPLLQRLYYPESPYEFSVIGAEILGSAYERFLGKVITLEPGRRVRIEDKPEVRKAGGVFYTPAYIVNDIVKQTLALRCEGRTPQDVAKLRVLDPACGSGSFLLGAYQYLLDWHLAYYQAHPTAALPPIPTLTGKTGAKAPGRRGATITPDGRLSSAVKKAILLNNLYGVDLDAQAVEVTKLSLLLKCLEGETPASIQQTLGLERVLPTIDQNIRVGNSLVETDFYDELDFAPDTEKAVKPFSWHDEFAPVFKQGGFDVVIGNPPYVQVTNTSPETAGYYQHHYSLTNDLYTLFIEKGLRLMHQGGSLGFIVPSLFIKNVNSRNVREYINTHCENFILEQKGDNVFDQVKMPTCVFITQKGASKTARNYFTNATESIFTRQNPVLLSSLATITRGLEIGRNKLMGNGKYACLTGGSIDRYVVKSKQFISESTRQEFNKNSGVFAAPKLMVRETGSQFFATLDDEGLLTTRSIYNIKVNKKEAASEKFLMGIIGSNLFVFYFKEVISPETKTFPKVRIAQLKELPIPNLNLKKPADKKKHDDVVILVEQLSAGYANLRSTTLTSAREQAQARLRHLERRLDGLVYALYGLSDAEIAQVAG